MIKKLEVLANVAVIVTSVVLCTVLAKNYLFTTSKQGAAAAIGPPVSSFANAPAKQSIQPGTKISLPGIDWSKSDRTLLLALSTTCHFCTESAPFYQTLQQQKPNDLRLVALLPQTVDQSRIYLNKLGVTIENVVQGPLASVGVAGTPTIILIDAEGKVQGSWAGKLSDEDAARVLARLAQSTSGLTELEGREFK